MTEFDPRFSFEFHPLNNNDAALQLAAHVGMNIDIQLDTDEVVVHADHLGFQVESLKPDKMQGIRSAIWANYLAWVESQKPRQQAFDADTNGANMRTLSDHKVNPANDILTITVTDEPGAGGANHRYEVAGMDSSHNASAKDGDVAVNGIVILFQNGPIPETGVNGLTHEVLLAIVADRLRSFQNGPYACKANACALTHIEEAQHWLQQRTIERMRRGVEGSHTV